MKKTNLLDKLNKVVYALFIMTAVSFTMTSCDDEDGDGDEDPDPIAVNSVLEIVAESEDHTQLEAFVTANADLVAALGADDITLFAPNDAAFEKLRLLLGVASLEDVNPSVIASVLAFHLHSQAAVLRADIDSDTELSTAQGENITFNANGNVATGGSDQDVLFVGEEILATNGVVHVVETILIPPTIFATIGANLDQVSEIILLSSDFSILASAIYKADTYAATSEEIPALTSILADPTRTLTVFAPVNAVFEGGGITLDAFTPEEWYGLIANHVLLTTELEADLIPGTVFSPTAAGGTLSIVSPSGRIDSDGEVGGEAGVVAADIFAADPSSTNGVVHAIDGILRPATAGRYAIDKNFSLLKSL